jgi:outer membrane lipoprotein-sorting protein
MMANEILNRLAERYSSCRSYSDEGRVDFLDVYRHQEQLLFRTKFVAPNLLRFEWQDYGPNRGKSSTFSTLLIRENAATVHYTWNPEASHETVSMAIAGVTGCSAAAASIVLPLLCQRDSRDPREHHLFEITAAAVARPEMVDGFRCQIVTGKWFNGDEITLWIDASDYSLKRARRRDFDGLDDIYTFSHVTFDESIPSKLFDPSNATEP